MERLREGGMYLPKRGFKKIKRETVPSQKYLGGFM